MHRGYLPIWRKFFEDHPFWNEKRVYSKAEAWIYILKETRYKDKPKKRFIDGKMIEICYGEFAASIRFLANAWRWTPAKTYRYIKWLINERQVVVKAIHPVTHLIICNFEQYDPKRNTDEYTNETAAKQQRNTDETKLNKVKNVNKGKKEIIVLPDWLDQELWSEYKRYRSNGKNKFTPYAQQLAIKKLTKLREDGNDPNEVIQQTMVCNWSGLFPLKKNSDKKETTEEWIKRVSQEQ